MTLSGIAVIAAGVLAYSFVSGRLADSLLTPPMVFTLFGFLIGGAMLDIARLDLGHGVIHVLAEITLLLVLFTDAARIDLRLLRKQHDLPIRMLLIGLPLTIAMGTATALLLPLGLGFWHAALLAAVLAPTDAALGQAVVSNASVPVRIRQALNVESGLNDGIAVPVVFFFAAMAGLGAVAGAEPVAAAGWLGFAGKQIGLGLLIGVALGAGGGRLMDRAVQQGWMSMSFEGPAILAMAALAFVLAEAAGGNGFIAAFTGGLAFGCVIQNRCAFVLEFAESEGQLLTLLTFLVFGAAMLPRIAEYFEWIHLLYAVLSLTVIRMLPVSLSLLGTGIGPATHLFLGWFGPRGLASIIFALLILERGETAATGTILSIALTTVTLSIVLHGATAAPWAGAYARKVGGMEPCAELEPASELPTRTGMAQP